MTIILTNKIANRFITGMNLSSLHLHRSKSDSEATPTHYVRQLTPKKWKQYMLHVLQEMQPKFEQSINLIADLSTIVKRVSQEHFIKSALQLRPFKPQFNEHPVLLTEASQSTVAETIAKSIRLKTCSHPLKVKQVQLKRSIVTQNTLFSLFSKQYHPYHFIIKNFTHLIELKSKQQIDSKKTKIAEFLDILKMDLKIFNHFMKESSSPYSKIFKVGSCEDEKNLSIKMAKFIENYVFQNQRINGSIHKIILYLVRSHYAGFFDYKIQDFCEIASFNVPEKFQISGCYLLSMNSLIQFSQCLNHEQLMRKLLQFRNSILKDIDHYYKNMNKKSVVNSEMKQLTNLEETALLQLQQQNKKRGNDLNKIEENTLQLNAEIQLQIIRFVVVKLKVWACELYSRLKFLEFKYGEEQIAYKFEHMSFMWTQIMFVFQILGVQN